MAQKRQEWAARGHGEYREVEEKEFFTFCKSFDSYGVLGPALVTPDEVAATVTFLCSVQAAALADDKVQASLGGKAPKKVIVVSGRLVNIVV